MSKYDIVIIGSGLGGLECGVILSKEGYNVCVVEKHHIFGGCLQSFKRSGHILDTGMHYVGSMEPGQILHQYFKYFGIIDKIKTKRLDKKAFDVIHYQETEYNYALGFDNFANTLSTYFPSEEQNIIAYTNQLKEIIELISVENLRKGLISVGGLEYFSQSASQVIDNTVQNNDLRNVLAGTSSLYAGIRDYSTFYHHAMINASNIEGAHRFVDGSQSVADELVNIIRANGGTVLNKCEVTRLIMDDGKVTAIEIEGRENIEGQQFISNIHPVRTFELVDKTSIIKKAFQTRLNSLPNSYGLFTVYLIMKKKSFPYINSNHYLHGKKDTWYCTNHPEDTNVTSVLVCAQANSTDPQFAEVVTLLSPMFFGELAQWENTSIGKRGDTYDAFKQAKAEEVINFVSQYYPNLRNSIETIHTASPLTYRDYTGTPQGSAYGIIKNSNNPLATMLSTRTKIENLFLTGQNLHVHGALGVTLTAANTCSHLLGSEYLAKKIGNA